MIVAAHDQAQMGGLFDKVGDLLENVRDVVVDVTKAPLENLRKALRYGWAHVGGDVRQLVMTFGPIAASVFLPGAGEIVANVALGLLEQDRLSKEQRVQYKKALRNFITQQEQLGNLAPGVIDIDNPEHLEAIVLAGNMPADVRDDWFRMKGLAPPKPKPSGAAAHAPAIAVAAGLLVLGAVL